MKRREFIALLGGAAASALPSAARGQPRTPKVGVLVYGNPASDQSTQSFRRAIRELGYVDGQNIAIEYRAAEGNAERLPELASELLRGRPAVLFTQGGDVAAVAVKASQSVPIVFVSSADPVGLGLVESLARPGRNATGVTLLMDDLASKRLALLKEIVPRISRVAFLYDPDHVDAELKEAERAAASLEIRLDVFPLHFPGELDATLGTVSQAGSNALYVVSSRHTVLNLSRFVAFAADRQLPLAGGWGAWAKAGGLLSYGPNLDDMVRRAAGYVDRVLKGTKPGDLPVQQPTRFELVLNLKTANTLHIDVPWFVQQRADEVIE